MYKFPDSPAFLGEAAANLGLPVAAAAARGDVTLAAVANLCAQAAEADTSSVAAILTRAAGFRDRLEIALLAADLMVDAVREGRGVIPLAARRRTASTTSRTYPGGRGRPTSLALTRSKKS